MAVDGPRCRRGQLAGTLASRRLAGSRGAQFYRRNAHGRPLRHCARLPARNALTQRKPYVEMPVSGLSQGPGPSRNPPLQDMAFRAVQVVPQALEVAEQQRLAQGDKAQFSDDAFLHFQHVCAFFEFTTAGSAFDFVGFHRPRGSWWLKKVELVCRSIVRWQGTAKQRVAQDRQLLGRGSIRYLDNT